MSRGMIDVTINGEGMRVPAGLTATALFEHLGLNPKKVALERNLEIVPKSRHGETVIAAGDTLEIVHFIGGG